MVNLLEKYEITCDDLHPFLPQKKLFKAYDIRGEGVFFTDDFLYSLANGFAHLFQSVQATTIVIGYDVRQYSQYIAKFLAYHLHKKNIQVQWLGQVTTPMMAFMANECEGHGIMVTASHSEKHIHGIKWLVSHVSPSASDIQDLYHNLMNFPVILPSIHLVKTIMNANYETVDCFDNYQLAIYRALNKINQYATTTANQSYRLVIDCMNGATSLFAKTLFETAGYDCVVLNNVPNANFPKGNPDPAEQGRLAELCQAVIAHRADIGLAFDGDGDRLMIVDGQGQMISPDNLLFLLANISIEEAQPNHQHQFAEIIFDVKCSHHLPQLIKQRGGVPSMAKTGSSLMRKSLQTKTKFSIFAGELSGHFLFNDGYFVLHDDAMYAGLRLLNWLQRQPEHLSHIINHLPKSISTADMYLPITNSESGQSFVNKLVGLTKKSLRQLKNSDIKRPKITTIDGLRLDFEYGFGIVRKSNTGNFLTVRFSGNTLSDLQHIQQIFVDLCRKLDDNFANQVAIIQPN